MELIRNSILCKNSGDAALSVQNIYEIKNIKKRDFIKITKIDFQNFYVPELDYSLAWILTLKDVIRLNAVVICQKLIDG